MTVARNHDQWPDGGVEERGETLKFQFARFYHEPFSLKFLPWDCFSLNSNPLP